MLKNKHKSIYIGPERKLSLEIIRSNTPNKVDMIVILNTPATLSRNEFKKNEKYLTCSMSLTIEVVCSFLSSVASVLLMGLQQKLNGNSARTEKCLHSSAETTKYRGNYPSDTIIYMSS
uniref:Uncharacterized protein n=1 Tax=Strongyloides venezuelensis TaxID=75913 RepID=A0A0K0EYN0_STRVS